MDYSFFDFLRLIGSLGLFLYGMKIMSEGLQKFAGDSLRRILMFQSCTLPDIEIDQVAHGDVNRDQH